MKINGTYIDQVELMEYYRMASAYICPLPSDAITRYKRMLWASDRYARIENIPSARAYKALHHCLGI